MNRIQFAYRLATVALLVALGCFRLLGQGVEVKRDRLTAAMSLQLLRFAEWPEDIDREVINIGVVEGDRMFDEFSKLLKSERYSARYTLRALSYDSDSSDYENLHALFFSDYEPTKIPRVIKSLEGQPIVLMGAFDDFLEMGGMVNFTIKQRRFGFEIHTYNAKLHNIEFRAKLLRMASAVIDR